MPTYLAWPPPRSGRGCGPPPPAGPSSQRPLPPLPHEGGAGRMQVNRKGTAIHQTGAGAAPRQTRCRLACQRHGCASTRSERTCVPVHPCPHLTAAIGHPTTSITVHTVSASSNGPGFATAGGLRSRSRQSTALIWHLWMPLKTSFPQYSHKLKLLHKVSKSIPQQRGVASCQRRRGSMSGQRFLADELLADLLNAAPTSGAPRAPRPRARAHVR